MLRGNMPQKTTGGSCSHFACLGDRPPVCAFRGLNQHVRMCDGLEIVLVEQPISNPETITALGRIVAGLQESCMIQMHRYKTLPIPLNADRTINNVTIHTNTEPSGSVCISAISRERLPAIVNVAHVPPVRAKTIHKPGHDTMLSGDILNSLLDGPWGECVAICLKSHLAPAIVRKNRENSPGGDPSGADRETEITIFTGVDVVATINILMVANPRYCVDEEERDTLSAEHWRPFLVSCFNYT